MSSTSSVVKRNRWTWTFYGNFPSPPSSERQPWIRPPAKERYRIGYVLNDGFFEPSHAAHRALRESMRLLQDAGHELVEFDIEGSTNPIYEKLSGWEAYRWEVECL